MTDWTDIKHFKKEEFACSHCGENKIELDFVKMLDDIRESLGQPMVISSGYRCPEHPREKTKDEPGPHSTGRAADILCAGEHARDLSKKVVPVFPGIGIHQKGDWDQRFIHVDQLGYRIWTY